MYMKNILTIVFISSFLLFAHSCKKEEINQRKPYLLYFNERDTATFLIEPPLYAIDMQPYRVKAYSKNYIKNKKEINYNVNGEGYTHTQKHIKKYLPKDSLKNYEIIKSTGIVFNVKILDLSNPDSAFIVEADKFIGVE